MATATTPKTATAKGLMATMAVEEKVTLPRRGRGVDPDVVAIRAELVKQLAEPAGRSFSGVSEENREVYARKIRAAGKLTSHDDKGEIKVSTRYDKAGEKLIWGPDSVLDSLSSKN